MKKKPYFGIGLLLALLAVAAAACASPAAAPETPSPTLAPTNPPAPQTYSDPFAYCAAVGTIDTPDARYTGPQISDEVINGFIQAAGLQASTMPTEMFRKMTIWRCMNSQVYACNFGANLPCSSKANTDKTPTPAMADYCKENPDSEFIPMSVTGHSTIYSWHCVKDTPELLDEIAKVDAAGYLETIWYPVQPGAAPRPEVTEAPVELEPTAKPAPTALPTGGAGGILFASDRGGAYDDLYLLDLATGDIRCLTNGDSNTFAGPFSPDGSQIVFTGFGLTHSYIGRMAADGANPVDLTQVDSDEGFPAWSPDGQTIAFTSRRDGNNEIYVMNADGSQPRRLTNNPTDDFAPAWSPDGSQIAFVSDRDNPAGVNNLYVMDAGGSNVRRLTSGSEIDYTPAWSPDGAWIAFRASHDGPGDLYLIHPDGTGLINVTDNPAEDWAPAWSPDGALLAFQTDRDGNWEIYTIQPDGSNPTNQTNDPAGDQMPYWAPAAAPAGAGLANPASVNCTQQGGTLAIEKRGDEGEFGVCTFEDNRQCEEWALLRGGCPVGGLKVTGYITPAARYCAITGGEYAITGSSNTGNEQGTCAFKSGKTCDVWEYYNGACDSNP